MPSAPDRSFAAPAPERAYARRVGLAGLILGGLFVAALSAGRVSVGVADIWAALLNLPAAQFSSLLGANPGADVVAQIRLPRVLVAMLIGAALAVSGLASQVALRNPLAAPDVLGVSAGAALGACIAILTGRFPPVFAAFAGGLAVAFFVDAAARRISARSGRDPVLLLILIGVSIGALCAAGITLTKWWADPFSKGPTLSFWLAGGLGAAGWRELAWLAFPLAIASTMLVWLRGKLPILELGDEVAATAGANVTTLRRTALVAIALATAATVAVGGLLGWLALIVPHLARALSPRGVAQPWALAALIGAGLMLAVDTLCRSVADVELPPGVVLAVLGVPGFLWVLLRGARL
jgi:iron complex transport system permease protein